MPDPREHAERRGVIESILRLIPGFRGYLEKEYRRDSDHLARTWLADRLQRAKRGLDDATRVLADAGQIDQLPQCERLRGRLDRLIGRLRGAVRGYSGFFDFVRVDEDVLDDVYDHDFALMHEVDQLAEAVGSLARGPKDLATVVPDLLQRADAIDQKVDQREDLLKGLAE